MTTRETALLDGIKQMEEQAHTVGLCALPFTVLYDEVSHLINEKYLLLAQIAAEEDY